MVLEAGNGATPLAESILSGTQSQAEERGVLSRTPSALLGWATLEA